MAKEYCTFAKRFVKKFRFRYISLTISFLELVLIFQPNGYYFTLCRSRQ